jgi:hypothetical protein
MINESLRLLGVTLFAEVLTVSLFFIYGGLPCCNSLILLIYALSLPLRFIVFTTRTYTDSFAKMSTWGDYFRVTT